MNTSKKIIITDTNIITDLYNAGILDKYIKLDNTFIVDIIKSDEIKSSTGNISLINTFKTIGASQDQVSEIYNFKKTKKCLSPYDIINYIIARDSDAILATGDRKLKEFAEENGIIVIRTLGIIEMMIKEKVITTDEAIYACNKLKFEKTTRIPTNNIDELIEKIKKNY